VVAGTEATGVDYSGWLLAFALFFFLNLAFLKRYADLRIIAASGGRVSPGRSYSTDDAPLLLRLGPAAALMAMGVLGMYVQSEKVVALYAHPLLLWLLIPILIAWTARAWQIAHRGGMPDDPVRFTLYDPVSWGAAAVCGVVLVLASLR
jgi:hypothetical protein